MDFRKKVLDNCRYDIASEPNEKIIDNGLTILRSFKSQAIIALGGGAVMDSSKMIAAGGRFKKKKAKKLLHKFLFVKKKTLPLITIPTTAGTGAEMTVASVVTNRKGIKNSTVIFGLNIHSVILDGELMMKSPFSITYGCGIDALSHGLEGVISKVKVKEEDMKKSMECVKLVLDNLPILLKDPLDKKARQNMCISANYGGNAINKQLAGNVHAFAHSLGARYHIPHGKAIALSLIPVIKYSKNKCLKLLGELARYCKITETKDDLLASDKLIEALSLLIKKCNFGFEKGFIKTEDIKSLIKAIEGDSINYCAPIVLKKKEIRFILSEINKGE